MNRSGGILIGKQLGKNTPDICAPFLISYQATNCGIDVLWSERYLSHGLQGNPKFTLYAVHIVVPIAEHAIEVEKHALDWH
jgi:hypothetical protein